LKTKTNKGVPVSKVKLEYIWMDGHQPTQKLRSKTKILVGPVNGLSEIPDWGFDGSSTMQAEGNYSDCLLKPVYYVKDPIRGENNLLVMCEVMNADGSVHSSNTRAHLRDVASKHSDQGSWFGIEQEYTLFQGRIPLGWPEGGYPAPQGPFYCGVGADEVYGRDIVEEHLELCIDAGLEISGINAEVMPGQWEYQVGPLAPLESADQLWLSRWLLYRIAEDYGVSATLHPKPVKGDWNGAGAHTNFSTKAMRSEGGLKVIEAACEALGNNHDHHITIYGAHNEERLTGLHETCSISDFRYGVSDRGASIRIPMATAKDGFGYLEDRRPSANMDPYRVCAALIETTCS
jgi:glutamine synthetase|tara:strand:+ start:18112 stop:19152 length:1041 start_codon:yes stop_codon:yes gene_type:complete